MDPVLETYVIYFSPSDFPGMFVVQRFEIRRGEPEPIPDVEPVIVAESLLAAREAIPDWMTCLARHPSDEPQIVETWI